MIYSSVSVGVFLVLICQILNPTDFIETKINSLVRSEASSAHVIIQNLRDPSRILVYPTAFTSAERLLEAANNPPSFKLWQSLI